MGVSAGDRQQVPLSEREIEVLEGLSSGATDREIAQQLHLSVNTVKWYNRQIYGKLGVGGREEAASRARELGLLEAETERPRLRTLSLQGGMPGLAPSSFVGRTDETEELRQLLSHNRLVTVVGSPGVGKTRLALQVVAAEERRFDQGATVVNLAPVRDPSRLAETIAEGLGVGKEPGVPIADSLIRTLRDRQRLLLLDNFEHLTDAAPFVADLLARAPHLQILVTSRERLNLYGEQVYPLEPLALEDAVRLFYLRSRALEPKFDNNEEERGTIERLCEQLDGLPLAIELAASRVQLLPPTAILDRLRDRLDALKGSARDRPERHQTLRAALDWGYDLLTPDERHLFCCLGVFVDGSSLEAVEAVTAGKLAGGLLDALESLRSKSLIWQQPTIAEAPRFFMLETIRTYAVEQLEKSGEAEGVRDRHAEHFAALAERAEPYLRQSHEKSTAWRHRLTAEWRNIETAFGWSMERERPTLALRLLVGLQDHLTYAFPGRSLGWTERALELSGEVRPLLRARAIKTLGILNHWTGNYEEALELGWVAAKELREHNDWEGTAWALSYVGSSLTALGDYDRAEEILHESLELFERLGARYGLAFLHNSLGELMRIQGENQKAWEAYRESERICVEGGIELGPRWLNLAATARLVDKRQFAIEYLTEALEESQQRGMTTMLSMSLAAVAGLARYSHPLEAARLMGASAKMREDIGFDLEPVDRPQYEGDLQDLRVRLEEATFDSAWSEGRSMAAKDAVATAFKLAADLAAGGGGNEPVRS